MIDDVIILEDIHKEKAKYILDNTKRDFNDQKTIFLISGSSGCGKSETSFYLRHLLYEQGVTSFIISTDDYYFLSPKEREKHRKENGIESVGLKEINWEHLNENIENFLNDQNMDVRRVNKSADQDEIVTVDTSKINCLIIEGLYAGQVKKNFPEAESIFLKGDPEQTINFRKKRMKEDENCSFRQQIVRKESEIVRELRDHADLEVPYEIEESSPYEKEEINR